MSYQQVHSWFLFSLLLFKLKSSKKKPLFLIMLGVMVTYSFKRLQVQFFFISLAQISLDSGVLGYVFSYN